MRTVRLYVDLSTAGDRTDRIFVQDVGVPGLSATRKGEPIDMAWSDVMNGIQYDGDAAAQKLSERAYRNRSDRVTNSWSNPRLTASRIRLLSQS